MASFALEPGSIVAGRYRIVAPLGAGASARVYLADDLQLKRQVAVKVLHETLAEDQQFLKRFRAEAQAAAALNHPHVMHVYDSGDTPRDDGPPLPFLVMEFVGGGSLRAVLDSGPLLTASQALAVGLDAAKGLEYAHREGFVHRDIKPANLLFGPEGRLRIADFGLARALAEATWTEPQGVLLGTAKYSSPEQAQGLAVDGKSDVYALALLLVEAVTGEVPFARDTIPAMLMARCESDLVVPRSLGRLAPVLESAGRLDPAMRVDAGALVVAFFAAAPEMDKPAQISLPGAIPTDVLDEFLERAARLEAGEAVSATGAASASILDAEIAPSDITLMAANDPTAVIPLPMIATRSTTTPTGPSAAPADRGPRSSIDIPLDDSASAETLALVPTAAGAALGAGAGATELTEGEPVGDGAAGEDGAERSGSGRGAKALVVFAVVALILGGGALWWFGIRTPSHAVPNVVGRPAKQATSTLEDLGFKVSRSFTRVDGTTAQQVVAQKPTKGTELDENRTVALTVSLGNPLVPIPALDNTLTAEQVTATLGAGGLKVGSTSDAFDEKVPAKLLISATPATPVDASGQIEKGSSVNLVISKGPQPRTMPSGLGGQQVAAVRSALKSVQLSAHEIGQYSETVPAGVVMSLSVADGVQVPRDSVIDVTVSKGPAPIPIPDVVGKTGSEATSVLTAAGFVVSGVDGSPANQVLAVDPPVGEPHAKGTAVRIFTRK